MPGVIDVTTLGGTTKEFHVDLDPGRLLSYNVTLDQVIDSLAKSNTDVGGNYLTMGAQSFNVRGMGLMKNLDDIADTVMAEKEGTPIFVRNLGETSVGHRVRLGTFSWCCPSSIGWPIDGARTELRKASERCECPLAACPRKRTSIRQARHVAGESLARIPAPRGKDTRISRIVQGTDERKVLAG